METTFEDFIEDQLADIHVCEAGICTKEPTVIVRTHCCEIEVTVCVLHAIMTVNFFRFAESRNEWVGCWVCGAETAMPEFLPLPKSESHE